MYKGPHVTTIIGGRKLSHLKSTVEALSIRLIEAEIDEVESAYHFDVGFPMNFLASSPKGPKGAKGHPIDQEDGTFRLCEEKPSPFCRRLAWVR